MTIGDVYKNKDTGHLVTFEGTFWSAPHLCIMRKSTGRCMLIPKGILEQNWEKQ